MEDNKQKKGIQEGPPIWVESLMTREEWSACYKEYSTYRTSEPPNFIPEYYRGGKWRNSK